MITSVQFIPAESAARPCYVIVGHSDRENEELSIHQAQELYEVVDAQGPSLAAAMLLAVLHQYHGIAEGQA